MIHAGPLDIIRDGIDGYLVPPFDTDAMWNRLAGICETWYLKWEEWWIGKDD